MKVISKGKIKSLVPIILKHLVLILEVSFLPFPPLNWNFGENETILQSVSIQMELNFLMENRSAEFLLTSSTSMCYIIFSYPSICKAKLL